MNIPNLPRWVRRTANRAVAIVPIGARRHCCLCGHRVKRFLPYREGLAGLPAVLTEQDVVGSDVENFECPACGCHDRERHLFLYLQASGVLKTLHLARILHFAPERHLQRVIAAERPAEYLRADLFPRERSVQRLDLTNIALPDDHFDIVIANHVLEHVGDDARALREVLRVLRPGGHAILQTPYANRLTAKFEDTGIVGDAARLQAYGQEDHYRLYGADFQEYIASFGFVSRSATHVSLLPDVDPRAAGVNAREPLLLFAKPGPT